VISEIDGTILQPISCWRTRPMSESGLGCAKTPAPAAHVETSQRNCAPWSRIVLRARCSIPCWRIVFSTLRNCMSFHTGWVTVGHSAVSAQCPVCPKADMAGRFMYRPRLAHIPRRSPRGVLAATSKPVNACHRCPPLASCGPKASRVKARDRQLGQAHVRGVVSLSLRPSPVGDE
jgi:hypothetical protein